MGKNSPNPTCPTKPSNPFVRPSVHEHIYGRILIQIFFIFGFWTDNGFKVFGRVSTQPARPLHIPTWYFSSPDHPPTHSPLFSSLFTSHSLPLFFSLISYISFFTFHSLSLSLFSPLSRLLSPTFTLTLSLLSTQSRLSLLHGHNLTEYSQSWTHRPPRLWRDLFHRVVRVNPSEISSDLGRFSPDQVRPPTK